MTFVVSHTLAHGVREGVKVSLTPLITDFPIIISSLIFLEQVANMNYFLMGNIRCRQYFSFLPGMEILPDR
ncbi:MAG: hypothetical protein BWX80_00036 [Candidatus Hydrogenedentes bacterium ADurb.Bin101]|nr:MAG: hypothetical protein BWX80_00036 [Candidatus Hydrogenedentes bacterium ADurb.Bin101]